MARKTLLTEGEIRQFMKLASLHPIGAPRLQEMGYGDYQEKTLEEQPEDLDIGAEEVEPDIGGLEDIEGVEDVEVEEEPVDESPEGLVMDLLDLVKDWAADHDVVMSIEGGDEEAVEDEIGIEDVGLEGGELEGGGLEAGGLEGGGLEDGGLEEPGLRNYQENQEALVAEVATRVVARLSQENRKEEMASKLAERILKRLTKSK